MTAPLYRIKLYGHSGQDEEWFAKKLAVILETTDEEAEGLVRTVPVVIKDGLDKDRAERLKEILAAINALFLVEPMGETAVPAESLSEETGGPASAEAEKQDARRADIWMTVGVGCAAFLVLFSVVGYIFSWKSFLHQPKISAEHSSNDRSLFPLDPKVKDEKIRTLRAEIGAAEKRATILGEGLKLIVEEPRRSSDSRARRERDNRLIDAGRKLADARSRALLLRKELRDLESR